MELESPRNWHRIQVWQAVGTTEGSAMQNSSYKLLREYTVALMSQSIFQPWIHLSCLIGSNPKCKKYTESAYRYPYFSKGDQCHSSPPEFAGAHG